MQSEIECKKNRFLLGEKFSDDIKSSTKNDWKTQRKTTKKRIYTFIGGVRECVCIHVI